VSWDSIAGLQDVKRLLRRNLVILPMRPDIAKGMLAPWRTVLFFGPPGTGKTYLAKAVATECKRTFFNITSATITSRWHGESEKLIQFLFAAAEEMKPSTIFFDEIDSIASQRGRGDEHEASRRMKAQLLTSLEGAGSGDGASSFILAATNFPWDLDEALVRRFQKRIYIPLPDKDGRTALLKMHLTEYTDDTFDFELWGERTNGYSCSDLTNLCRDAVQIVWDGELSAMDTQMFIGMNADDAKVVVSNQEFGRVLERRKPSVTQESLLRYQRWSDERGAS
jgi:katanin p60 ATPase-containing subunit A1